MSEYLNKIVYLSQDQYNTLMASTNNPKTLTVDGITHTYDASSLYITSNKGDADTVNGHTVNIDVPYNALFTDHYHTSGTWDDITYTATSVNGANPLTFTLPTDNRYYKLDGSNTGTTLKISTQTSAYTNQIQFMNSTTKKGSIGCDNNGITGIYAASKVVLRAALDGGTTTGLEVTTAAVYPSTAITLGTASNKWSTIYGTTFDGTTTSLTHIANASDGLKIKYSTTIDFFIGVGTGNINHGLYDNKASGGAKWILYAGSGNVWYFAGDVIGNVSGSSGSCTGNAATATTATNLSAKPALTANGNNITVTAGEKTSDAFTVPYATSAGGVAWSNVSDKPIDFGTYNGALNTNGWKTMGARTSGSKIYIAQNRNSASWNSATYSSSLVFGCSDTKGLLDIGYNSPIVTFGGSSNNNSTDNDPNWYFKLSGTSGQTYTFPSTSKTLAASDGSNASGTSWNISITGSSVSCTGNATSASRLSNTSAIGATDRPVYFTAEGVPAQTTYRMVSTNVAANSAIVYNENFDTGIWYVNNIPVASNPANPGNNISDGAMYVNKYSDSWIHEIYGDYRTGQIAVRGKNNGTWQAWRKILDSSNYTDYAVTLTGTNASGNWNINAATATSIQTAGTTAQFYRGDNSWSNIIKQTANAALGIDTNLKIGTARKDLNFDITNGSGSGINDGYAGGITWGASDAAYAGIYYQTSSNYGSRLIFGTTNLYANGAYARMIIQNNGNVGIGTLSPDTLLTVNGNAKATKFIGALEGNADTASKISAKLATTTKTYLLGTLTAITTTAANVDITGDTGVYLTTTAGELSAARHSWNVSGTEKAYTVYNTTDDSIDFVFI